MNIGKVITSDGTIKLSKAEFSQIISNYYQKKYKISGIFDFLPINYEYIEETTIYDYSLERNINVSNKRKVNSYLPCLIDKNSYEYYKKRNIVVPGIIELKNINEEIKKSIPSEIIMLSNSEIIKIFEQLGYSAPLYNWFYDVQKDEIEYSVTVKRIDTIDKTKVLI